MSFKSDTMRRLETLEIKFAEMKELPTELQLDIEKLKSHMLSLRGLVNKRLSDYVEEEEEKPKVDDGLNSLRGFNG